MSEPAANAKKAGRALLEAAQRRIAKGLLAHGEAYLESLQQSPRWHELSDDERLPLMDLMAGVAQAQGKPGQAEAHYRRALALRRSVRPEARTELDHNVVALAASLRDAGRSDEAESLLEELEERQARELGSHPDRARTLALLGQLLSERREFREAENHLRRAVEMASQSLGEVSPAVVEHRLALARMLMREGRLHEAESVYREALLAAAQGGEVDLEVRLLVDLGELRILQGQFEGAAKELEMAVFAAARQRGTTFETMLACERRLAAVYQRLARQEAAEAVYKKNVLFVEETLGALHPVLGEVLCELAGFLNVSGQAQEAERLYLRALDIWEESLGPFDVKVAQLLVRLASIWLYGATDRGAEALDLLHRALDIFRTQLGAEHPSVAETLTHLGVVRMRQGELARADALCRHALKLQEAAFGESDPRVAPTLNLLASIESAQGNWEAAEGTLRRALSSLGPPPPEGTPEHRKMNANLAALTARRTSVSQPAAPRGGPGTTSSRRRP